MRIALINQYYAPAEAATAQLLADLGEHLAAAGHDVTAVCSRRSYLDPSRRYAHRERIDGVDVVRTWSTGFGRASRAGRLLDYVSFLIGSGVTLTFARRFDVAVCLTTPPMISLLGVFLGRLRGTRSLFWVMDVYPDVAFELGVLRSRSLSGRIFSWLARYSLRKSDRVVTLGQTMAARVERLGASGVEVVHNWADGEAIHPVPIDGHPLRAEWGWHDRFVVLYSGNMGLAHEFDTVLRAAEILRDDPRVLFAFIASGPRRETVEHEARRRGLTNVVFKPLLPRNELGRSLTSGNVHLVTVKDGMQGLLVPSKIYGILAAGRPTLYIGPEDSEVRDIVREGGCGICCRSGDSRGLADAIRRYASDGELQARDGERARELFEERFSKERALAEHQRIIESLVDPSS